MKELGIAAAFLGAALLASSIVDAMDAEEEYKRQQKRMREQKNIEPYYAEVQVQDPITGEWVKQQ